MVFMDWFDYDLYDSDIGDYMDEDNYEYGSDRILGESDDSQSTFISFNSGISTVSSASSSPTEESSQDSDSQTTAQDTPQQQASVVIVNSGTGGILWRNRSDDDEESRMSSSSNNSIRSGGEQSMMGDNSRNSSSRAVRARQRYFMNQRRRQARRISSGQSGEGEAVSTPIVIESSETETENEEDSDVIRVQAQLSRDVRVQLSPVLPSARTRSQHAHPHRSEPPRGTAGAGVDLAAADDASNPVIHDLGVVAAQEVVTNEIVNVSNPTNNPLVPERDAPTLREIARAGAEKRKGNASPVQKRARLNSTADSDDDEVDAGCNICYDNYSAVGPHRPACLKCGHIFGFSCLERWLKVSCSSGNRRCPSCNKKAHTRDIRLLYCCNLRAVDNTRVHQLTTDLEQEKIQNSKYKVEISSHRIKIEGLERELTRYKGLEKSGLLQNPASENVCAKKGPVFHLSIALVKGSGESGQVGMARSLVYDDQKKLLLATHQNGSPTGNGMFNGFGYSLVSLLNACGSAPKLNKFFLVSPKSIRDACFHPLDTDLLLIVSLDKSAKLIDVRTGSRVYAFQTESPLWSCAWDLSNPNLFLVGGVNGQLTMFDKRATAWSRPIATGGTNVGVVSIIGIRAGPGRGLARGGFLVCKLNAVLALEPSDGGSRSDSIELLDACGPFMSMSYLASRNQVLLSSRPGPSSVSNIRHRVFSLDQSPDGKPVLSLIQTILGGSLAPSLSRSYIWPSDVPAHCLVYAYDAASKSLCGWSVSDAVKKVCLPCADPVLDICRVEDKSGPLLAALSDAAVHLYRHP